MISVEHGRAPFVFAIALALVALSTGCHRHERSQPGLPSTPSATPVEKESPAPPAVEPLAVEPLAVEPAPAVDPPPRITTDIDPAIFQWAHGADEYAALDLVIHLDGGEESERLRRIARAQESRSRAVADIGLPKRFARGDAWLIFAMDRPTFTAKVRGFWPSLDRDDKVSLRVLLGRGPEGLAVRSRDWKGRPRPTVHWDRDLAVDHPSMAAISKLLRRAPETALVAELLERRALTIDELQASSGRFVGGTHLVCIDADVETSPRQYVAGMVLLDLDGRVTPIIPLELTADRGHGVNSILDIDGDGYEEAIVEIPGDAGIYEHLLYWQEGRPVLEPLVEEDA